MEDKTYTRKETYFVVGVDETSFEVERMGRHGDDISYGTMTEGDDMAMIYLHDKTPHQDRSFRKSLGV